MDSKITLQDLAYGLASRSKLRQEAADAFVRNFFETVKEYVTDAKGVKIKGLGTFKLVNVQDRESVDVNTGERILIPGHPKVVFTPDNELRAKVNKPFEAFSTIIINDGTSIEDMERIDGYGTASGEAQEEEGNVPEPQPLDGEEEQDTNTPTPPEEPGIVDLGADCGTSSGADASSTVISVEAYESTETPTEAPTETNVETTHGAECGDREDNSPSDSDKVCDTTAEELHHDAASARAYRDDASTHNNIHTLLYALLIFGLMLCSYFAGYYRWLCPCLDSVTPSQPFAVKEITAVPAGTREAADTVTETGGQEQDTITPCLPEEEMDETPAPVDDGKDLAALASGFNQVPDGDYLITGTAKTRIMKRGDNLYKFAKEELGDKSLVRYIIVHNGFGNPDVVPLGYKVKIPRLVQNKQ